MSHLQGPSQWPGSTVHLQWPHAGGVPPRVQAVSGSVHHFPSLFSLERSLKSWLCHGRRVSAAKSNRSLENRFSVCFHNVCQSICLLKFFYKGNDLYLLFLSRWFVPFLFLPVPDWFIFRELNFLSFFIYIFFILCLQEELELFFQCLHSSSQCCGSWRRTWRTCHQSSLWTLETRGW